MTIDEPVHQENQALATTGGGASASVEIEELEKLGERIAELSAQISAATYELLVMIRDFDGEGGSSWLPDGTHVSAETSRRLACDSARVEMRHAADGRVLDVGRRTRAISPALRRALEHRDGGCRFPGCGLRFCDAHHVEPWAEGGATSLKNTVLLCRRHHRTMHEDGFSMDLAPDGEARFYRPDGRPLLEAPALPLLAGEPVTALVRASAWPWMPTRRCPTGRAGRSTTAGRSIGCGTATNGTRRPPPGDGPEDPSLGEAGASPQRRFAPAEQSLAMPQ